MVSSCQHLYQVAGKRSTLEVTVYILTVRMLFRYFHRCLNIPKLVSVRFTSVPSSMTLARMIRLHKLPDRPRLLDHGLREMEERDVPQVTDLFSRYMKRFTMFPVMSEDEVRHQFLSGLGEGPRGSDSWKIRRDGQVVWAYVVEVRPMPTRAYPDALICTMHRTRRRTRSPTLSRSTRSRRRS